MPKVLIVDDSPIIFKMIKRAIEPAGYEIVGHAENGLIALEMYDKLLPDVVTMDVTMPVMEGLEASEKIISKHPNAKIILLSAMSDTDLVDQAKKIGINHFNEKPIVAESLLAELKKILE